MMKLFKWKTFFITGIVCLLPILFGVALWEKLPDAIPIHFDIYGTPDNYSNKGFAVFGLPLIMLVFQWISCMAIDSNSQKNQNTAKIEAISKWIIPFITVALYIITIGYAVGFEIDIRRAVCVVVGLMFIVLGNYLPKLNYVKNYKIEPEKARKINRFGGYMLVIMGILLIISLFFPPEFSAAALLLVIPFCVVITVYSIIKIRK